MGFFEVSVSQWAKIFSPTKKKILIFVKIDRVYCFWMEYWEVKPYFWSISKHSSHLILIQLVVHGTPQSSKATILNSGYSSSSIMTAGNFFSSLTSIVTFYITFLQESFFSSFSHKITNERLIYISFGCSFGKLATTNSKKNRSLWVISATFFCNKLPAFMRHSTF